ncbi:hypothetical protein SLEP1_g5930 [Rubroshorea leprosula]|nr:hypothetical protein SLEP1_g5930 [Rubroshorea leprosula]
MTDTIQCTYSTDSLKSKTNLTSVCNISINSAPSWS